MSLYNPNNTRNTVFAIALLTCFLLLGCSPHAPTLGSSESVNPAPRSHMSFADADQLAAMWVIEDTAQPRTRAFSHVSNTSSMTPTLDSHSVLLLEPVLPSEVGVGDIVCYENVNVTDGNVCHRVAAVNHAAGTFLPEGDNNLSSDGTAPLSSIRYRVAGILYTK